MLSRCLTITASLFVLLLCLTLPASSGASDWVISISTKHIRSAFDYPDARLQPLIRATVKFEQGLERQSEDERKLAEAGYITEEAIPSTLYEDIYYSRSIPVGLRRFNTLAIRPGTPGTVKVLIGDSQFRQEEAHAAANAAVRIFLDAYLKKSALRMIVVTKDDFDLFVDGMQRYGFRRVQLSTQSLISAPIVVSVRSEPVGRAEYLSYGF